MKQAKIKQCRAEGCENEFKPYYSTEKYCSVLCAIESKEASEKRKKRARIKRKAYISPISKKRQVLNSKYSVARAEFLEKKENKKCPITNEDATEIHHIKGRTGYADNWARENNVPLLIDKRYFLAVSRKGHRLIEENPEWAKKQGYSEVRTNTV